MSGYVFSFLLFENLRKCLFYKIFSSIVHPHDLICLKCIYFEHIDRICTECWRCWFTLVVVVGGFSQQKCDPVNSGCWMFAQHLLPSIHLSSSAAGNLTTQIPSPGKWKHIMWNFWPASLILTDSINVLLIFYNSLHKTGLELLMVLCSVCIWLI